MTHSTNCTRSAGSERTYRSPGDTVYEHEARQPSSHRVQPSHQPVYQRPSVLDEHLARLLEPPHVIGHVPEGRPRMTTKPPQWLSVREVAEMAGVSRMTIYRQIHEQHLRAYRIGKSFRVDAGDAKAFLRAANTIEWEAS